MNYFNKLQEYINNKGHKKIIYNFIAVIVICLIALITWDTFSDKPIESSFDTQAPLNTKNTIQSSDSSDEIQLENILSQIKGVGEVDVMITYESSSEVVPASNTTTSSQVTEEKDAQGGARSTTQENLTNSIVTSNNNNDLVVIKEIKPQIRGVVVVAEGAGDIKIKSELIEAVRTVFQVPAHRVMVYEKNILKEEISDEKI